MHGVVGMHVELDDIKKNFIKTTERDKIERKKNDHMMQFRNEMNELRKVISCTRITSYKTTK